jgi:hypothetical protein
VELLNKCATRHPTVMVANRMSRSCALRMVENCDLKVTTLESGIPLKGLTNGLYLRYGLDGLYEALSAAITSDEPQFQRSDTIWISGMTSPVLHRYSGLGICMLEPKRSAYTDQSAGAVDISLLCADTIIIGFQGWWCWTTSWERWTRSCSASRFLTSPASASYNETVPLIVRSLFHEKFIWLHQTFGFIHTT